MRWKFRRKILEIRECPLVMGILNVTPDSFSDGGLHLDRIAAVERGLQMLEEGADIIDVGGESTRPGAAEISVEEEISRVIPVITSLRSKTEAVISVDTTKSAVAKGAMDAGADIINDVSAFTYDDAMTQVAADTGAGVVLMHMLGDPRTMQDEPVYGNVVEDVAAYLMARVEDLVSQGIDRESIAIDPGIGFGKTLEHNLELLAGLDSLINHGMPVIVGLSRKSFLGKITESPVDERLAGSLAGLSFCVMKGVHIMRVHDVKESVETIKVLKAVGSRQ
jgi:dihydropteroate synthase